MSHSPLLPITALNVYGSTAYGAYELSHFEIGNAPDGTNDPSELGVPISGVLEHPGSVQWYYLNAEGSYLVGLNDDAVDEGFRVQVYRSRDLSMPLKAYGKQYWEFEFEDSPPMRGQKFIFDRGPWYIKVFHEDHVPGLALADYQVGVRRLGCTNKGADACPLIPNTEEAFTFPEGAVESSPTEEALYFELAVEGFTIPNAQDVRFDLFGYDEDVLVSAIVPPAEFAQDVPEVIDGVPLVNLGGPNVGAAGNGMCGATGPVGLPLCNNQIAVSIPNPTTPAQKLMWMVQRNDDLHAERDFSVAWSTDLTVAYGGGISPLLQQSILTCQNKSSDGSPHDEIHLAISVDGVALLNVGTESRIKIGSFKTGERAAVDGHFSGWNHGSNSGWPFRYKSSFQIIIIEDDDLTDDEYFTLSIPPLPFGWGPESFAKTGDHYYHPHDATYHQITMFSHGLQLFTAP
ncbi:MAG: hypothetical protein AAGA56_01095 [Myxococcota bacterium]